MATFMPELISLSVARALTGISAAIILPASSGIIGSLYRPGKSRTLAYAAISGGGCAGSAFGDLVSTVLTARSEICKLKLAFVAGRGVCAVFEVRLIPVMSWPEKIYGFS